MSAIGRSWPGPCARIERHGTEVLVVALGFDTGRKDPTGTWDLGAKDFEANGRLVGSLQLPTLVVQEGGYRVQKPRQQRPQLLHRPLGGDLRARRRRREIEK